MGIAKGSASLLIELTTQIKLHGRICQLGRQALYISKSQFLEISRKLGFEPSQAELGDVTIEKFDDVAFFKLLGFQQVNSLDYSNCENPTYIIDFNNSLPEKFNAFYDAVYDGGTLEHIFNIPQCLKNIHFMLKEGGLVIHGSPSTNHVDHGFYMFSPTIFYDWYRANNWEIITSYIFEYEAEHDKKPWLIYQYKPGCIDHLSFGGWGNKLLGIWFVARKTKLSTCDVIPQQSVFVRIQSKNNEKTAEQPSRLYKMVKYAVRLNPIIYRVALWIWNTNSSARLRGIPASLPKIFRKY